MKEERKEWKQNEVSQQRATRSSTFSPHLGSKDQDDTESKLTSPVVGLRKLGGLDRFRDGSDLVDLEQKSITGLLLNGSLDTERVGD